MKRSSKSALKPIGWSDLYGNRILQAIRTDVRHPFSSDANGVALEIDGTTVFIFENPNDGYRSSAIAPLVAARSLYEFGSPDYIHAPVKIRKWEREDDDFYSGIVDGLQFIDTRTRKIILTVGTSNTDDYYPSFVCDWRPENLAENAG